MKIKQWKDVRKGRSCFILASGPSLNRVKPEDFVGKHTFVCNDAFLRGYTAEYWVTTDPFVLSVFENLQTQSRHALAKEIFSTVGGDRYGSTYLHREFIPNPDEPESHSLYPLSLDLTRGVYDANSPVHLALQVAAWMGFTSIFIVGADFRPSKNLTHFYGNRPGFKEDDAPRYRQIVDTMHTSAAVLSAQGVKVYNCSEGSRLEELRFVEIRDALASSEPFYE